MSTSIVILRAGDGILKKFHFKPYRNIQERQAVQFQPGPNEPQIRVIKTPWGGELTVKKGDYIVNEMGEPENCWPVERSVFEQTYRQVRPGIYSKTAITYLVPLEEITDNPNQLVRVHTREGAVTVRAGDFYLAKGPQGEIWPIPREKVESTFQPME